MLAGVCKPAREQFRQIGMYESIGGENIFRQTDVVGESIFEAYEEATKWVESQPQLESDDAEDKPVATLEEKSK